MGTTRDLFRADGIRVVEHICTYGPGDRPFEERHSVSNIAFVVDGAFGVRTPAGSAALGPGSILLGNEGDPYTCAHEVGRGDVCVAFGYSRDALEEAGTSLGIRTRFRGSSRVYESGAKLLLKLRDGEALWRTLRRNWAEDSSVTPED